MLRNPGAALTSFEFFDARPARQPVRLAKGTIGPTHRDIEVRTIDILILMESYFGHLDRPSELRRLGRLGATKLA